MNFQPDLVGVRHRTLRPPVGKDPDARTGAASVRLRGSRGQGGRGQGRNQRRQGTCGTFHCAKWHEIVWV